MSWFRREDNNIESGGNRVRTEGLWTKCDGCSQAIWKADLEANLQVCPKCGRHGRISAQARIASLLEPGFEWLNGDLKSTDPLHFTDLKPYKERLAKARSETGLNDAIVNVQGFLGSASRGPERDRIQLHRRQHGRRGRRNHCASH